MFKKLEWETKCIKQKLFESSKYADDIILFSLSSTELQKMVQEMHVASDRIGPNKTNIGENINIKINGERLEQVEEYTYLEKELH